MTYSPQEIFTAVDQNTAMFFAIGGVALIINYVFFISAALDARRDKVFTFPLALSTLWFAHDLSYVLSYNEWFNVYGHWYVKNFWYGLIPTTLFEAWYIYQTWLYGKDEILPRGSRRAFNGFMVLAILAGLVSWYALKQFLDDPLYVWAFGSTGFLTPIFVIGRMMRRGDAKGQSVLTWTAYTCMQICWFSNVILLFGDAFHTPAYLAMAATSIVGGVAMAVLTHRMNRRNA